MEVCSYGIDRNAGMAYTEAGAGKKNFIMSAYIRASESIAFDRSYGVSIYMRRHNDGIIHVLASGLSPVSVVDAVHSIAMRAGGYV